MYGFMGAGIVLDFEFVGVLIVSVYKLCPSL